MPIPPLRHDGRNCALQVCFYKCIMGGHNIQEKNTVWTVQTAHVVCVVSVLFAVQTLTSRLPNKPQLAIYMAGS